MGILNPRYSVRYSNNFSFEKVLPGWNIERNSDYIKEWNDNYDNYFNRLEASIKEEGILVPFILTKGDADIARVLHYVFTHHDNEKIPEFPFREMKDLFNYSEDIKDWYLMTWRGGARYYVMQRLGITHAPSIILDYDGSCDHLEEITNETQFRMKFHERFRNKIENIKFDNYDIDYLIMPEDEYNF